MDRLVRRRLEMAVRARDFNRAHPSTDANFALVLERLGGHIVRLEELAEQQQAGFQSSRASVARRKETRRRIHHELLRHLATVAQSSGVEQPGQEERFQLPPTNAPNEAFRTLARQMLERGQAQKELLSRHGLADKLLEDLAAAVNEFDASVAESNEGRRDHVGARAEMEAVSVEVLELVQVLDGLNRYRFSGSAELRAAWESAKNVVSGPQSLGEKGPEHPPATPGEVKPAA